METGDKIIIIGLCVLLAIALAVTVFICAA